MTNTKFKKLLKQIYNGNKKALEPIYAEYYEFMVNSAKYILKNEYDAQDAAADVITKIFKMAIAKENPNIDDVSAYINTSIRNSAVNIFNKRNKTVLTDYFDDDSSDGSTSDSLVDYVMIKDAINALPPKDRDIAFLFYFHDNTVKTIAVKLDMPEGTVKWRLSEIKKKLYKILK